MPSNTLPLIICLSVGVPVVLALVILAVVCCVLSRKRNPKRDSKEPTHELPSHDLCDGHCGTDEQRDRHYDTNELRDMRSDTDKLHY